jgi:cytoskeletal protein CcmA (bactofilin family)
MTPDRHQREQGFAMVSVLLLTMLVMLTASLALIPSFMGRAASLRSGASLQSTNITEAALDFGLAALNATVPTSTSAALGDLPAFFVPGTGGNASVFTYSDPINGHFFGSTFGTRPTLTIRTPATVPVPGGAGVAADYRIVRAETRVDGALKRMEIIVYLRRTEVDSPLNPFKRAITARGNLAANGTDSALRTDSYDSAAGTYGGSNLGTNGGVHSNGSILDGGVYKGNVSAVGAIDSGVAASGMGNTVRPGVSPEDIPDAPAAPATTTNVAVSPPQTVTPSTGQIVNLGAVSMSGNSSKILTLNAGTYVMSSLGITGQASILVGTGPVVIYVTGDIAAAGNGIVNSSALPRNLRLIETNPTATVTLAGNGNFYGAVQAPANQVTISGNGEFFGAIVANTFRFNGSNSIVHYDDDVSRAFATTAQVSRPSIWQTLAFHNIDRND